MGEAKLCDSCKSATASLFCRNDAAFLCIPCDSNIHAANKVASRHARVWMCEVCEQAPAHVTCKADAAALCISCDRDIHSANPLACRHERFPVVPFYDGVVIRGGVNEVDEAEAASWLMPNLNAKVEGDFDSYLDLDFGGKDKEANEERSDGADGVVPEHCIVNDVRMMFGNEDCFGGVNVNSINQSVASSSHEVGVVPDGGMMTDVSNPFGRQNSIVGEAPAQAIPLFGAEREAKVLRYKEKRKNRKFEKTIRYASRKAYAETRPRIKGRFAKKTDNDAARVDQMYNMNSPANGNGAAAYGVVPSY